MIPAVFNGLRLRSVEKLLQRMVNAKTGMVNKNMILL